MDAILEGLSKAGLDVPAPAEAPRDALRDSSTTRKLTESGMVRERAFLEKSIAVLPFVNRSPDPGNEYFSDGLTEEIISDLSRIDALKVISRNSSMALKGTTKDTFSIAKELGVTHVVSGSVRRAGDALRVTAELIEAASDTPIWSEKYSGTVADVFGIQEEIALKIVAALKGRLTESDKQRVTNRPIGNVVAYDCYLRARQEIYEWVPESQDRAIRLVDQALATVGENPLLLATKGQIFWNKVNVMLDPDERHLDQAADCARRALAIDPDDYLGLFLKGLIAGLIGETANALGVIHRAHQLRPSDPNVLAELCRFANASGIDVAGYVEELVKIDPLTPVTWIVVAIDHLVNGRLDEAVPPARRILELAPRVTMIHILAAWAFASAGLRDEAIELLEKAGKKLTGTLPGSWALFLRYALDGDADRACAHMTPLLERGASLVDHVARTIADGYSLVGRNDDALKWIRIGMNRGFINYPFLAMYDPLLANVRSDPRFPALMLEVKSRWEELGRNLPSPLRAAAHPPIEPKLDDLRRRLLELEPVAAESTEKSIAVLPFVNMSGAPEDEYFSDGISEEIINALAKVSGLKVAARTSAFSFKGQKTDIKEIARRLNVTSVLEGSVRKAGNRLRINAQLIDIADGCQLWSERFDRELDDIFVVQDEIATAIAKKLEVFVGGGAHGPLVKTATRNMEAYESYLKGRHAWEHFGTNLYAALEHFERATALDPEFALAYAGIADAYGTLGFTGAMRPREAMPKAKAAAGRALQLDDQLAEAHCALAYVQMLYDWDWAAAEKGFLRSIELNPNYAHAMHHYGHLYHAFVSCRIEEGIEICRRAVEIDPLAGYPLHGWLANLYIAGRTAEAIDHLQKELTRDPSIFHLRRLLALCYVEQGKLEEAQAAIEEAVSASGRHPWAVGELGGLHALCGRVAEAEALQAELVARSRSTYIQPTILSFVPALLGKFDEGFAFLEQAIEERDGVIIAITTWPYCRPFWSQPRYAEILKRINLKDPRRSQKSK